MELINQSHLTSAEDRQFFIVLGIDILPVQINLSSRRDIHSRNAVEQTIEYGGKEIELNKIKPGKRDGKGVKIRV